MARWLPQRFRFILIAIFGITGIVAGFVGLIFAKSVSDPIRKLRQVADDISRGKLDANIEEINGKNEIGDLARSFGRTSVSLKLTKREIKQKKQGTEQKHN